jgi:hypothetical protein
MKVQKTKDYDMFVFREDNRAAINDSHVKRLIESIKARNLLELRPICVNSKMEVMDGQHRLLAAKELGVEIYYQIDESLSIQDIINLNVAKGWGIADYLNFYVKNGYEEYKKLQSFMKKNDLTLEIALHFTFGKSDNARNLFKKGEYKFIDQGSEETFALIWQTIETIKKMNGHSNFTRSSRFWIPLLKLFSHPDFESRKWFTNLSKFVGRITARASSKDYEKLFSDIYNWRATTRLTIEES